MVGGACFGRAICLVRSLISSLYQWLLCCFFKLLQGRRRPPIFLGYFLQPNFDVYRYPERFGFPTSQFLPASTAGENLKNRPPGAAMDASLSFIGGQTPIYITGSSGGFLLGCSELSAQQHYFVCNPVTREWRALPKPNNFYSRVALAFICRGENDKTSSLDRAPFTVYRAGISKVFQSTRKLELETFSSETGEWRESTLTCARPFKLQVCNWPPFELDNVIYWLDISYGLLAHDLCTESLELIKPPGKVGGGGFIDRSCKWGRSEGKIIHARHNGTDLEVWQLLKKKYYFLRRRPHYQFILLARVSLTDAMFPLMTPKQLIRQREGKNVFSCGRGPGFRAIHPRDSRLVLLVWNRTPYWYNHENGTYFKICHGSEFKTTTWTYFLYEQPHSPETHLHKLS